MTIEVRSARGGISFGVKAQPRARRAAVLGEWNGCLRVAVREPAEDGRANAALLASIAAALGVRADAISLAAGERSSRKVVVVRGLGAAETARRLDALASASLT
ncbi:MAG TPA: DUF167 family protein [Planctomycetota bacterium]|nr:DUF167 family protein [Planctomycetota bacterium]